MAWSRETATYGNREWRVRQWRQIDDELDNDDNHQIRRPQIDDELGNDDNLQIRRPQIDDELDNDDN